MKYIRNFLELDLFEKTLIVFVFIIISGIIFSLVDSVGLEIEEVTAYTIDTKYTAAHVTINTTTNNGIATTSVINHPEKHEIKVDSFGFKIFCKVNKHKYEKYEPDKQVIAKFATGRITGNTYCKGII